MSAIMWSLIHADNNWLHFRWFGHCGFFSLGSGVVSLIEKLGGYEKAKAEFEALKKHPELYSGEFAKNDALLLEHRRAHNIYENEDEIIFAVLGNAVMHYDDCLGMFLSQGLIRHATPEEIQAGRRLEVCGG